MPYPMPDAVCVLDAPWRLSPRRTGCVNARGSPWRVLRRLLLGPDGAVARGRRHERALDRPTRITHSPGEAHSFGPPDHFPCWDSPHRGRCVAIGNVLTAPIFAMTSLAGQPGRATGTAAKALAH